jgi:hypothetical protein
VGGPSRTRRAALALLLAAGLAACGGPFLVFPGGALRGEVAGGPVEDWSFAKDKFVDLETRPADPYSVTVNYVVRDGRLYVDPAEGRRWLGYMREDPRVRIRFGGVIYPARATLVQDPAELEGFDPDRRIYRIESR